MSAPVLDRVVGQDRAVSLLRASVKTPVHAYLFVGHAGTGKRDAAIAFAAALMCHNGGCGECVPCQETLAGRHPDLVVVERRGPYISVPQAKEVMALAQRAPRAARFQVLVLVDFHLVENAGPALLKTIEEPPDTTVIIVIAEAIPSELVTIASRCVRVEFEPLGEVDVAAVLEREGTERSVAEAVAAASAGRLDRARLLVSDAGFGERLERWRSVPARLDGTGATVMSLAEELVAASSEPVEVVKARQAAELAHLADMAEQAGERGVTGRQLIDDRHRREQRRVRTDELRAGLGALAGTYRSRLGDPLPASVLSVQLRALGLIDEATERLTRNVNEPLLLEWLLCRLDGLA